MQDLSSINIFDLAIVAMYFVSGIVLCKKFQPLEDYRLRVLPYGMLILHFVMTVSFYFFVLNGIGDAKGYYKSTAALKNLDQTSLMSNGFIETTLFPFVHYLDFSFFSSFFLFSLPSFAGFVFLYDIAIRLLKGKWSSWLLLFLMPSMHFWTGAIGKDALIFFGLSWILHNYCTGKKIVAYIIPLLIVGLVRFYVLALIGAGTGLALVLLSKQIKLAYKVLALAVFGTGAVLIMPFFLETIAVGDVSNISKQSEIVMKANQEGGGAVDLQGSNLAVKWFSYLFRPFIFEARSAQALLAAVENVVWLVIFWKIAVGIRFRRYIPARRQTIFWICVACIFTVTLPSAFILSNLGIASRQKIMIVPMMLYLFFESYIALQRKIVLASSKKQIQNAKIQK